MIFNVNDHPHIKARAVSEKVTLSVNQTKSVAVLSGLSNVTVLGVTVECNNGSVLATFRNITTAQCNVNLHNFYGAEVADIYVTVRWFYIENKSEETT